MKFINVVYAVTVVKLVESSQVQGKTLEDFAKPFAALTPNMVLDMEGILLSSLQVGDVVGLANTLREKWGERFSALCLINVSENGKRVLEAVNLQTLLQVQPNLDQCYHYFSQKQHA